MVNVRFIAQQHPLFRKRKLHSTLLIVAESTFLRRGRSEELLKLKNPDQGTNPGNLNLLYIPLAVPSNCAETDRKSTRLNSSHVAISYAVFSLKKKELMENMVIRV